MSTHSKAKANANYVNDPKQKIDFIACSAFVTQIDRGSPEALKVWLGINKTDPNYSAANSWSVDFKYSSSSASDWSKVVVDDLRANGGFTSIDPYDNGDYEGGIYLPVTSANPADYKYPYLVWPPKADPTAPGSLFEYRSVLYYDDPGSKTGFRRYHGFHVTLLAKDFAKVYRAGSLDNPLLVQLELDNPDHCDGNMDLDKAKVAWPDKPDGALYVKAEKAAALGLSMPKLPPSAGADLSFPVPR